MEYDSKVLGKRIRNCRKNLTTEDGSKTNQDWLAEQMNYSRKTISEWETGEKDPSIANLFKLRDLFQCDIGHLVGEPGHEFKTKAATDIVNETNLSEDAVIELQKHKKESERPIGFFIGEGSIALTHAITKYKIAHLFRKHAFIPALVSYMLTSSAFDNLVDRICSQNICMMEYTLLPDVEKEIITESYNKALQAAGSMRADDISLIQQEFDKAVEEYAAANKEDICDRHPFDISEECHYSKFIDELKRKFNLVRMTSDRVIEMNTFLNSRDLFNIVSDFMAPIGKMQKLREEA